MATTAEFKLLSLSETGLDTSLSFGVRDASTSLVSVGNARQFDVEQQRREKEIASRTHSSRRMRGNRNRDDVKKRDTCAVCLSDEHPSDCLLLPCAHAFHSECISQWLELNFSCPLCRQKVAQFTALAHGRRRKSSTLRQLETVWAEHFYQDNAADNIDEDFVVKCLAQIDTFGGRHELAGGHMTDTKNMAVTIGANEADDDLEFGGMPDLMTPSTVSTTIPRVFLDTPRVHLEEESESHKHTVSKTLHSSARRKKRASVWKMVTANREALKNTTAMADMCALLHTSEMTSSAPTSFLLSFVGFNPLVFFDDYCFIEGVDLSKACSNRELFQFTTQQSDDVQWTRYYHNNMRSVTGTHTRVSTDSVEANGFCVANVSTAVDYNNVDNDHELDVLTTTRMNATAGFLGGVAATVGNVMANAMLEGSIGRSLFWTTARTDIPTMCLFFAGYEHLKKQWLRVDTAARDKHSLATSTWPKRVACAGVAGAVTTTVVGRSVTPLGIRFSLFFSTCDCIKDAIAASHCDDSPLNMCEVAAAAIGAGTFAATVYQPTTRLLTGTSVTLASVGSMTPAFGFTFGRLSVAVPRPASLMQGWLRQCALFLPGCVACTCTFHFSRRALLRRLSEEK